MSAPEIRLSNDAIIKALQAFGPTDRDYSKQVIAALKVAAPYAVAAELERLSDKYGQEAKRKDEWAEGRDAHDRLPAEGEAHAYSDVADELLAIATRLRWER